MNRRLRLLSCLTWAALVLCSTDAAARAGHKAQHHKKSHEASGAHHRNSAALKRDRHAKRVRAERHKTPPSRDVPSPIADAPPLSGDLAAVKDAIDLTRKARISEATAIEKTIADPAALRLVEWFILRHAECRANFDRYAAFIADSPGWPNMSLMRKRAEAALWQERADATTTRNFIGDHPISAKGRFALARVLLAEGDRDGAARLVRQAWHSDELTERTETDAFEQFRDLLTPADHRARMDKRIGAKDLAGARRAAQRLGSDEVSIVKACAAGNTDKALDLLNDVATEARSDLGYKLCRIRWMTHHDRIEDATRLMLTAQPATMALQDTDEWWRERRSLARKLLDQGKFDTAYQVVRDAAMPASAYYRADFHFMCGWIALRYRNDPATARAHFAHIDDGAVDPIVLARANYWRGRVAEATGQKDAMRAGYEAASRYPTAYYGQLARAKLDLGEIELRAPDPVSDATLADERVRAAEILYTLGERDVVLSLVANLAEQSNDVAVLVALAELTGRHNDARAMLQIGKLALARGLAFDRYAFPTIGIPQFSPIAPAIERSIIYSVVRTESAFNQKDKSSANAVGLMQVTPEAGRDTAKRFGVTYDWDRMVADPAYNTQMGAAELSALLKEYAGSHIMAFAGYNAGRGRVRDWVKLYGDPRDSRVDAIDWVERIPFSETRNYVQRVIENVNVYRAQFESPAAAASEPDHAPSDSKEATSAQLLAAPTSSSR
ncbi:lytic transglycosylase domain-containing protein [Bradyrhizobium sp.]|uniref:lytic transglycosylase domain-containing protein n=1 Tax=Bradyrhizobium sp. TaxID=376 RepID=UPI00260315E0|nr:lytic transglycosylase domain-containing protein [Bradyrhizobium sp.]